MKGAALADLLTEEELEDFLNSHGDRIYTYLCVLCRNEDHAAEALQNAYVKFLLQVRSSKVRRETAPQYLQTIAKNDYLGRVRRETREVELADDAPDLNTRERMAREEVQRAVQLVLLETAADPDLPADVGQVITLRFLENASVDIICQQTGRSQATVYRLMEQALSVLAIACRKAGLHVEDLAHG